MSVIADPAHTNKRLIIFISTLLITGAALSLPVFAEEITTEQEAVHEKSVRIQDAFDKFIVRLEGEVDRDLIFAIFLSRGVSPDETAVQYADEVRAQLKEDARLVLQTKYLITVADSATQQRDLSEEERTRIRKLLVKLSEKWTQVYTRLLPFLQSDDYIVASVVNKYGLYSSLWNRITEKQSFGKKQRTLKKISDDTHEIREELLKLFTNFIERDIVGA